MLVFSGFSFRRNCHVAVAVRAIAGQHGVIGMRGDVRCRNWKQATSFMDVRDRLPNGPSGPLSQLLGCSPNINEPFLTRDNGSLRTRINFISVGVLDGANSIWGAIYLLAGILHLRQKGCRRYLRGFARAQDLLRYVSSFITQLFGRAAVKRKGSFFHIFFLFQYWYSRCVSSCIFACQVKPWALSVHTVERRSEMLLLLLESYTI